MNAAESGIDPSTWTSEDIGNPSSRGAFKRDGGRIDITGGGNDIGGTGDQFHFAYQPIEGDFDLRVRVSEIGNTDAWAKAGLVARTGTATDSPYSGVFATPTISGVVQQSRITTPGNTTLRGFHPVNYPHTWLRLKRSGNNFSGFASFDGKSWSLLGTNSLEITNSILVGLAVTSHSSNQITRAIFEDLSYVDGSAMASPQSASIEPLGPSSRRTGLVISEIMYHPADRTDGKDVEFIEIFNSQPFPETIGEYEITGSIEYKFPPGLVLNAGSYVVIAKSPQDFAISYGLTNVQGGFTNNLPNSSGTIQLRNRRGAVLQEVNYGSLHPWPVAADGGGCSLVLNRPSYGEDHPQAWSNSSRIGGSPGTLETIWPNTQNSVRINEISNRAAENSEDFVELFNHSPHETDISGFILTDKPGQAVYRFPQGTKIAAGGFLSRTQSEIGFGLSSQGETVYLISADGNHVLDAVKFGPQPRGLSYGRFPNGSAQLQTLAQQTPGAENRQPFIHDVVINEIMFNPISGNDDDEYIELFNRGSAPISLAGWRFTEGVEFVFPSNSIIPAGGYLVVARNKDRLTTNYANLTAANLIGNFQGKLANGGERIVLAKPESEINTDPANPEILFISVDEVSYCDGGRWGQWADEGGSSLELIDPHSDNRMPSNWADSDESSKSGWVTIEHTGVLDHGTLNADALHVFLQGAGECLIDEVEVIDSNGRNLIANSGFESGTSGWIMQGTHDRSKLETREAFKGSSSLRVVASGRGDTGANRIRVSLNPRPTVGTVATIRAKVRWLRGHPELLMRLHGNYLEAYGQIISTSKLGTPGLANSKSQPNTGPAIYDVTHAPILPAADEPVTVTARVTDPDEVQQVQLKYRVDPSAEILTVQMVDSGTGPDQVAHDGLYTAVIPGKATGVLVAFHVTASDRAATPANAIFPAAAPVKECLVRFGETQPFGNLGTYRIWITRATSTTWNTRLNLHNGDMDATFVYGNSRAVYNIGTLYSGSPFVSPGYNGPTGELCGYILHFPSDDAFLGATDFVLDWPIRDTTLVLEQVAYWMAEQMDLPYNYRRYINLYVNGAKRGRVYEDVQQPNADVIEEFYPEDTEGDLFKIEDWFEFSSNPSSMEMNRDATLENFTTTNGEKKLARYRWNFRKRAVQDSANDYRSLFALIDAVTARRESDFVSSVESLVDIDEWMGILAVEHMVGNWDSFGYSRGKNMYTYKPANGKWQLLMWDIDFVMSAQGNPADTGMFGTIDPGVSRMMFNPTFMRAYYRSMQKALDGPLTVEKANSVMDARRNALMANGISSTSLNPAKTYITRRRANLQQELSAVEARFEIQNDGGQSTSSDRNVITLNGTAPVEVETIRANNVAYPVVWSSVTSWSMSVPLSTTTNVLTIQGFNDRGEALADAKATITVRVNGSVEPVQNRILISEIMYNPSVAGAEYVEIHNAATNSVFDLSGHRLTGIDFTFPPGTLILPGEYLVVVKDISIFTATYGTGIKIAGTFPGQLTKNGETLKLTKPGLTPAQDATIDEVTYESRAPWSLLANGQGSSLQLIDRSQDNDRVGNWSAHEPTVIRPEWKLVTMTGTVTTNRLLVHFSSYPPVSISNDIEGNWTGSIAFPGTPFLMDVEFAKGNGTNWTGTFHIDGQPIPLSQIRFGNSNISFSFQGAENEISFSGRFSGETGTISGTFTQNVPQQGRVSFPFSLSRKIPGGNVFIDDLWLSQGSVPQAGQNLIRNGDFESPLTNAWNISPSLRTSMVVTNIKHGGSSSLQLVATNGGFSQSSSLWQDTLPVTPGDVYTLSYWYFSGTSGSGLTVRLGNAGDITSTADISPFVQPRVEWTPGKPNSTVASVAPFPLVWLNELVPQNTNGAADEAGTRLPWVELYNSGNEAVSLNGFYLSANFINLAAWPFPPTTIIQPGEYLIVWLGGNSGASTNQQLHANFTPDSSNGLILLSRRDGNRHTILDYLSYSGVPANQAFGRSTDGKPHTEQLLVSATLGAKNVSGIDTRRVFINEWMASNDGYLADPATSTLNDFDDWFELYNPNETVIDLTGYTLTDDPNNKLKWRIPSGTLIQPRGFLIVWADEETEQNGLNSDLHTNFKLSQSGETLALYSPDGLQVDLVTFGSQQTNVSEGRNTDGAPAPFNTLRNPTPGKSNALAGQTQIVMPIIFDLEAASNGTIRLSWSAQIGTFYQVQYKDSTTADQWLDLGAAIKATTAVGSQDVPPSPSANYRFYRVKASE